MRSQELQRTQSAECRTQNGSLCLLLRKIHLPGGGRQESKICENCKAEAAPPTNEIRQEDAKRPR